MKTAVDKVGRGKTRIVNARFRAMTGHFYSESSTSALASSSQRT
jgi:hypothetical protein